MSFQSRDRLLGASDLYVIAGAGRPGWRQRLAFTFALWRQRTRDAALPGADGCAQPARCRHLAGGRSLRIGQAVLGEDGRPALIPYQL